MHGLHVSFDVVLELGGQAAEVAGHLSSFLVVQQHVTDQSVAISENFGADLAKKVVVHRVELDVGLETQRCLAFYLANAAVSVFFVFGLYVEVFGGYFVKE